MGTRLVLPPTVRVLADAQCGVLSTTQLSQLNVSRRTVERILADGQWRRIDRGLLYTAPGEVPWMALVWAGVLAGGNDAWVTGRTAARLHGLVDTEDRPVEILVPGGRSPRRRWFVTYRRGTPGLRILQTRRGLPCTSVADTVIDVCAEGRKRDVVPLITAAIQRRLTSAGRIERAAARRPRLANRELIMSIVADAVAGSHSSLEMKYLTDVERAHGLPKPDRQARAGTRGEFADLVYRQYRLVIELDGRAFHAESGFRDRRRDNRNAAEGWTTLRFGWDEIVADPCGVAAEIVSHLIDRGWTGELTLCTMCAAV